MTKLNEAFIGRSLLQSPEIELRTPCLIELQRVGLCTTLCRKKPKDPPTENIGNRVPRPNDPDPSSLCVALKKPNN